MKYLTPILETERLILKKGTFEDFKKVYEYNFTKLRDIDGEFEYVKLNDKDIEGFDTYAEVTDEVYDWIIYLKDKMLPIGNITADREQKEIKATELAFNLHPNYWGCNYMKEAVVCVMEYLFNNGFENILCGYSEGNIKSKRLNEKLGFKLYKIKENSWYKNSKPITDYITIMSKEDFYKLYNSNKKVR